MAGRPRRPTLLDAPQTAVLAPANSADLWRVLEGCSHVAGGIVLAPADLRRLMDAAAVQFSLERQRVYWTILPYLTALVVGGRDRVLWDTQRKPLLATLAALAQS